MISAWITIATTITVIAMLLYTKVRSDAVFLSAICVLYVSGVLDANDAFSGFSSQAVIVTAILSIVVVGVQQTGLLQWMVKNIFGHPNGYPKTLLRMMLPVAALSSFINNTTVAMLFCSIVKLWAQKLGISPLRLYIPMIYAVLMGGVCTLIGTPSNLVISELYSEATGKTMNMFAPFVPGVICLVVGMAFIIFMRRLQPEHNAPESAFELTSDYTVELLVPSDNPYIGMTVAEAGLAKVNGGRIIEIIHFDEVISPAENEPIMGGDRLIFAGRIEEILELKKTHGLVNAENHVFSMSEVDRKRQLLTAYVKIGSSLIGSTLGYGTFQKEHNLTLVAVARRGERLDVSPREVKLKAGDTLLLECPPKLKFHHEKLDSQLQFFDSSEVVNFGSGIIISSIIITVMLVLIALNVVSLLEGTILAAFAMVIFRCCSIEQAMNSLNWRLLIGMAGSIVLGMAMQKTGIAEEMSQGILNVCGTHPIVVMAAICLIATLITQLVMNVAVGAMFFPIMYNAAVNIGYDPFTFLIALMVAVNAAFATPIGAPANMLVYGPGGYRFSDYMRIGIPLVIIINIVGIAAACFMFPLTRF